MWELFLPTYTIRGNPGPAVLFVDDVHQEQPQEPRAFARGPPAGPAPAYLLRRPRTRLVSFSDHLVLVTMCRGSSVVVTMCPGSSAPVPFQDGSLKIRAMGEAALPEGGVMLRCRRLSVPARSLSSAHKNNYKF